VHGYCLGAALSLALSCDMVVADATARFGVPEGRIGLVGATALVPVIGRQWAKFLIMTGELIDAEQACRIGLALTVVPEGTVRGRCHDLAGRLARMPAEAVVLNKRAVDATADATHMAGTIVGRAHDALTLACANDAAAPDGSRFRQILAGGGMPAMRAAREQQWQVPWLTKPT